MYLFCCQFFFSQEHVVVFVSSNEKDSNLQVILKDPKWANRVVYIQGSALKDIDLKRCRYVLSCQNRVVYIQGSALKDIDLKRCRYFILSCHRYFII